jgi:hypothetical protein
VFDRNGVAPDAVELGDALADAGDRPPRGAVRRFETAPWLAYPSMSAISVFLVTPLLSSTTICPFRAGSPTFRPQASNSADCYLDLGRSTAPEKPLALAVVEYLPGDTCPGHAEAKARCVDSCIDCLAVGDCGTRVWW